MYRNQNNDQIVFHAQCGADAVTKSGNMSTENITGQLYAWHTGSMPKVWARYYRDRVSAGRVIQVIFSYSTPIAWKDRDYGWIIPSVSYSVTTSAKHQSQLYRLGGRHVYVPWDATADDLARVMDERMVFVTDCRGRATGTKPGPRYATDEMLAVFARNAGKA
ncbi:hypothetical protein SEA_DEJAVU_120 [Microbacterium Phage DejaVu]|nr:hypothetical protein SEA_DEJAVU_4 [Microbacterium Phage DejaVu]WNM66252.1 hypothetical protein SEA_DEJAVU_120 [Microbacterium Phage DejaVu]